MASIPLMSCVGARKGMPTSLDEFVKYVIRRGYRHLLEGLPDAIMKNKDAIMSSILASISTHLVRIELGAARLLCGRPVPERTERKLPQELRDEGRKAEYLGAWFGGISPRQTATILGFEIR